MELRPSEQPHAAMCAVGTFIRSAAFDWFRTLSERSSCAHFGALHLRARSRSILVLL